MSGRLLLLSLLGLGAAAVSVSVTSGMAEMPDNPAAAATKLQEDGNFAEAYALAARGIADASLADDQRATLVRVAFDTMRQAGTLDEVRMLREQLRAADPGPRAVVEFAGKLLYVDHSGPYADGRFIRGGRNVQSNRWIDVADADRRVAMHDLVELLDRDLSDRDRVAALEMLRTALLHNRADG